MKIKRIINEINKDRKNPINENELRALPIKAQEQLVSAFEYLEKSGYFNHTYRTDAQKFFRFMNNQAEFYKMVGKWQTIINLL